MFDQALSRQLTKGHSASLTGLQLDPEWIFYTFFGRISYQSQGESQLVSTFLALTGVVLNKFVRPLFCIAQ